MGTLRFLPDFSSLSLEKELMTLKWSQLDMDVKDLLCKVEQLTTDVLFDVHFFFSVFAIFVGYHGRWIGVWYLNLSFAWGLRRL